VQNARFAGRFYFCAKAAWRKGFAGSAGGHLGGALLAVLLAIGVEPLNLGAPQACRIGGAGSAECGMEAYPEFTQNRFFGVSPRAPVGALCFFCRRARMRAQGWR